MFTIRIAGLEYEINNRYQYIQQMCDNYIVEPTDNAVKIQVSDEEILAENVTEDNYSKQYLETLAVYRKICNQTVYNDTFLFHCSTLAIDDCAICFTAPSGTGKSTQARLWREKFGERVTMINDDKPLIKARENDSFIYGTPWCGKHNLSTNIGMRLNVICIVERSEQNSVTPITFDEAFPILVNQTYRPPIKDALSKTMQLLMKTIHNVKIYKLRCNISYEAVDVLMKTLVDGGYLE